MRQREQRLEQEKDLVVQQKLIRIKDQRIPRLQDLTMRPSISGRKCVGTIEAHQNGLRFTSTKYEVLDVSRKGWGLSQVSPRPSRSPPH